MIERKVIQRKVRELYIKEYMANVLDKPGYSHVEITRTPLGEKITVFTSKPGLIVGRKGSIIKELTEVLKAKFGLENPQIEVSEIDTPYLNPNYVAKHIIHTFERFGPARFKFLGHKLLENIMETGALGAEIVISGRGVPSKRTKTWRFTAGHLKKSGDIAVNFVKKGYAVAQLKSGAVGVKVSILTPDVVLPDSITFKKIEQPKEIKVEPVKKEVTKTEELVKKKEEKPKKETPKKVEKKEEHKKKSKSKEIKKEKVEPKKEKVPTARELVEKKENLIQEALESKEPKEKRKVITAKELNEKVPSFLDLAERKKWQS